MELTEQNRQLARLRYRIFWIPAGKRKSELIGGAALLADATIIADRHAADPAKAGATVWVGDGTRWNTPIVHRIVVPSDRSNVIELAPAKNRP